MKVVITGRKINLKDSFKEMVEKKLSKFDRIFDGNATAEVVVTQERDRQTVEITIKNNSSIYRAEHVSYDMNESLDKVIEAIFRQFRKYKSKLSKRLRSGSLEDYLPNELLSMDDVEEKEFNIVKNKTFFVKPMGVEEAVLEMNLIGHKFYMFRNEDSNEINLVYLRKDGGYGVLIPDTM